MKLDMYEVLSRWGVWARESNDIDYLPIAAAFKGLLPHPSNGKLSCCDGCVARLKQYKPDEYDLVIAHHVYGISLRKIARVRKCSDGTIRKHMQIAEGFISGCLAMLEVKINI
ncbi:MULTISPECIES: antiterminator Q family protein [Serratia]|uniref:antiterminator Q family protein n=1 Tax=Serratia TaxID=613 RepID=UPI000666C506|nr:antiterminator Q family protein [Serratia marcescens]MBH2710188.1 antitermination protein [Serratia marcescens]HEJ7053636.1 antitermination protein [Serratia marcescens]